MTSLVFNGTSYPASALPFPDFLNEVLELSEEQFPALVSPLATLGATALRDIVSGPLPIPAPADVKLIREKNFHGAELSPAELRVLVFSRIGRVGLIAMWLSADQDPGVRVAGKELGTFVVALGRLYSLTTEQIAELLVEEREYMKQAAINISQERNKTS